MSFPMDKHTPTSMARLDRFTQAGTERKRARRACKPCHALKAKCSGTLPACQRCSQKGYVCRYGSCNPGQTRRNKRVTTPLEQDQQEQPSLLMSGLMSGPMSDEMVHKESLPQNETSLMAPQTGEEELGYNRNTIKIYIDAYFEHVAPLPGNGFIHRAIFLRNWACGSVNSALLKAVCSASAIFVSKDTIKQEQAERWRAEAEAYIWANIGRPSMAVLQVLVVIISHSWVSLRFPALQSFLAVAAKMAYVLGLNHENESMSTTAREIRRRIMWSIFIRDKMLAAGQPDLISCPAESMQIQLPCNEKNFELAISGNTGTLIGIPGEDTSVNMGLTAYFCRLSLIRHKILQYTRRVIAERSSVHDSRNELFQLEKSLQELHSSLPKSMALDGINLSLRAFSPLFQRYVMFHVMWHQCHCDLYRFTLPGIPESLSNEVLENTPPEFMSYCQRQAIEHARKLVDLFQQVQKVGDRGVTDSSISICVYQCTQILIRSCYLGLLESRQGALEMLYQLMSATNVLSAVSTFSPVANKLYKYIQNKVNRAIVQASGTTDDELNATMADSSKSDGPREYQILDVLARIRKLDAERGEEVMQHQIGSPSLTTFAETEVGSVCELDMEVYGEPTFDEDLWCIDLDLDYALSSLGTVSEEFGESMMGVQS